MRIQRVQRGAEAPSPQPVATIGVARFVDIQSGFSRQGGQQFVVRFFEAGTHLSHQLGQLPTADRHAGDIAEKLADGRKRGMAGSLEKADQGCQPWSHQARLHQPRPAAAHNAPVWHFGHQYAWPRCSSMCSGLTMISTCWITVGASAASSKLAAAVGTLIEGVVVGVVKQIWREGWPLVPPMARLATVCRLSFSRRGLLGGLTISLEGGLEELPECFRAAANWASNSATRARAAHTPDIVSCS